MTPSLPRRETDGLPRVSVQLATPAESTPDGKEWLHEVKLNGYRMVAHLDDGTVRLLARNGAEWTARLGPVAQALRALPARRAIVDGELVVLDERGTSSVRALERALTGKSPDGIVFFAFDLLYLDGRDLRSLPLIERKRLLADLMQPCDSTASVRCTDFVIGGGTGFYRRACRFALEGVVSKRKDRPHQPGKGTDWVRVTCGRPPGFAAEGIARSKLTRRAPSISRRGSGSAGRGRRKGRR